MYPELNLGPLTLQTFGLMFALAFLAAGWLIAKRMRELDMPFDWAYELILAAAAGGVIGAKLWFAIQNGDWSAGQMFSGTGLVWYGGLIGGALAVVAYAHWRGILNLTLLDMTAPALALGYAVGRIGCQLSGDGDYGKVSNLPWAMGYPHGTDPTPPGVRVQPAPVYELIAMGLFAWLLWHLRDRFAPGVLFSIYLIGAGLERFLVEFVRRNTTVFAGLTLAQLFSLAMIAVGAGMWFALHARRPAPAR